MSNKKLDTTLVVMSRSNRHKIIQLPIALVFVATTLFFISGLNPVPVFFCTLLTVFIVAPGIYVVCRSAHPSNGTTILLIGIGSVIGLGAAAVFQQVFLLLGFSNGWLVPQITWATVIFGWSFRKKTKSVYIRTEDLLYLLTCSLVVLGDMHWFFYLVAIAVIYVARKPTIGNLSVGLIVSYVLVTEILPRYWYLNTDDRFFDNAYSNFIHRFGYWSWYGASDIWVPYHWLTHGIAGIYVNVLRLDPYLVVGIVIPVLTAIFLAILLVVILQEFFQFKQAFKAACLVPLLGVIVTGSSISKDASLIFGLTMLIVFLVARNIFRRSQFIFSLQFLITYLTLSSKFSTGIIAVATVMAMLFYGMCKRVVSLSKGLQSLVALFLGVAVSLVTSFGLLSQTDAISSRGDVKFHFGGILFSSDIWGTKGAFVWATAVLLPALGSLAIFILIFGLSQAKGKGKSLHALMVLVPPLAGSFIYFGVVAYSAENYLEAGYWLAIPFALGVVLTNFEIEDRKSFPLFGLGGLAALTGCVGSWVRLQSIDQKWVIQILGWGLLQLIVCLILSVLFMVWASRRGSNSTGFGYKRFLVLVCIFLLFSQTGPDIYRMVMLGRGINVWDQNFGESHRTFFYGSQDDIDAKNWLIENSKFSDVVATNHICQLYVSCNLDGQTPIAAWTERRTLIEAERFITGRKVDEILFGELSPQGHPDWVSERRRVSIEFANKPTKELLNQLHNWGVSWFWVDLDMTTNRSWTGFADVGFLTSSIVVLDLR